MRINHSKGAEISAPFIKPKIMIGTPTYDSRVSSQYAMCLAKTVMELNRHGISCDIRHARHMPHGPARNALVKELFESDCTHILFIDEDQGWDANKIIDLINANQHFVAAAVRYKRPEEEYPLLLDVTDEKDLQVNDYGLIKASRIGVALALIKKECFLDIRNKIKLPYIEDYGFDFFNYHVVNHGYTARYQGEDNDFCDKCTEAGINIWIYPDLETVHIGQIEYKANFHNFCRGFPGGDLEKGLL